MRVAESALPLSVSQVAGKREVVAAVGVGVAGGDELAIRLHRDRRGLVVARGADVSQHLAAGAEARIERAADRVPDKREVAAVGAAEASGDDIAVLLDRDRKG